MRCRSLAVLALAAAAIGCAMSSQHTTSSPVTGEDPSQARAEIARLQARIGFLRDSLRLPSTPPTGVSQGTPGWERCREVVAAADEICHAAVRICALAEVIADDDARASCAQAREDCKRARESAEQCK
ncbi:MAG TPA: hypothetical protein VFF06_02195 [Polyangia bacterium]|nr:hypothetical protein [Polyangia bacterium]